MLWSSLDALDPDQYIIATYLAVLTPGVDPDEALTRSYRELDRHLDAS
ncbi:MAG: hypothetical protein QW584_03115 [Thermofilaceae archaeon]